MMRASYDGCGVIVLSLSGTGGNGCFSLLSVIDGNLFGLRY
jgi:hypothetical protein